MNQFNKLLTWIPAVAMMIIIFQFSSAKGEESAGLSLQITESIVSTVVNVANLDFNSGEELSYIQWLHTIIRKLGHITEYAILAVTIAFPLFVYRKRGWNLVLWCVGISILYACSDEIHQLFISDRSGQILDVFIDSMGIVIGISFFNLGIRVYGKIRNVIKK